LDPGPAVFAIKATAALGLALISTAMPLTTMRSIRNRR
jgi:hypothetical protein